MDNKRYKVRLNSIEKIEELLQEIYDQACKQLVEIQNEINKLVNSTNMAADGFSMDEKAKYANAIHNFTEDKRKTLVTKFEIAKFMGEIVKFNGDANEAINNTKFSKRSALKLEDLKAALDGSDDADTYNLKKN